MKDTLSRSRAIRRLLNIVRPLDPVSLSPHEAIGLIASENIAACTSVPEQPTSLRDGYALRTAEIAAAAPLKPITLTVTQTVRAESVRPDPVHPGTAARVLTGGLVPPCADVVLAEEDVERTEDTITIRTPERAGWFVRPAGGEIQSGDIIVHAGEAITPQAAAVMIRTRVFTIQAYPAPTARVIALGSELSDPFICQSSACDTARFPADNLVLAKGLLDSAGLHVTETAVLPDNESRLVETLTATNLPDIIVTTGGTGHSERDFARSSAVEAGFETIFDHVDIRPGRNMFAARRGTTLLIGLPGPPVAVFACFHAVLLPALRRMRGLSDREPILGRVDEGVSAKPGGTWVVLCKLVHRGTDILVTPLSGKNAPPMLAMGTAHGVAVLGGGESVLPGGRIEISSTLF